MSFITKDKIQMYLSSFWSIYHSPKTCITAFPPEVNAYNKGKVIYVYTYWIHVEFASRHVVCMCMKRYTRKYVEVKYTPLKCP